MFRLLVNRAERVLPPEYDAKRARRAAIYAAIYEPAPVVVSLQQGRTDVERLFKR